MPDLEPQFAEMIVTLQAARLTVEGEMQLLSESGSWERPSAGQLGTTASTLAGQANALLDMMLDREADSASLAVVEVLLGYFEDVRDLLEVDGDGDGDEHLDV